jgi:hypothetical protein
MTAYKPTAYEVETFTGRFVDTKRPKASTIWLEDIAHALAQTCRYGGHCQKFYSVAEHAVFVSRRLQRQGFGLYTVLGGLHHDDSEAYLGDIPRPMKGLLGNAYKLLTRRMDAAIQTALNLPDWNDATVHTAIKAADNWSLFVEARHLLPSEGRLWDGHEEGAAWADGQPRRIITPDYWQGGLSPEEAKDLYLGRHAELLSL